MRLQLQKNSYRSAIDILLSNSALLEEIDQILLNPDIDLSTLSRSHYNHILRESFRNYGWQNSPSLFHEPVNPFTNMELMKENIALEIGFRHASLIGHNLLKFQLSSSHNSDRIDVGIFVVTTHKFQKQLKKMYHHNWAGAMNFEKVDRYLRHFKTGIQLPIYLVGIDVA
ncbi:restriction endonuclease BglII [Desulforamulus profundi]|uniref:Restriction endonuclease BglII n=1 Tax=Desulforamulus profundi TaxID=1383067 RepID=A0A2C6MIQ1_9FIRM|nr:BglII/BstYI family type II restriction endonuclease [Desulforamulus profundi]PHJ39712.1 restriction endonuclease BglII [Desulforamulus profundi]